MLGWQCNLMGEVLNIVYHIYLLKCVCISSEDKGRKQSPKTQEFWLVTVPARSGIRGLQKWNSIPLLTIILVVVLAWRWIRKQFNLSVSCPYDIMDLLSCCSQKQCHPLSCPSQQFSAPEQTDVDLRESKLQ